LEKKEKMRTETENIYILCLDFLTATLQKIPETEKIKNALEKIINSQKTIINNLNNDITAAVIVGKNIDDDTRLQIHEMSKYHNAIKSYRENITEGIQSDYKLHYMILNVCCFYSNVVSIYNNIRMQKTIAMFPDDLIPVNKNGPSFSSYTITVK
jgi:phage-related protein